MTDIKATVYAIVGEKVREKVDWLVKNRPKGRKYGNMRELLTTLIEDEYKKNSTGKS